MPTLMTSRDVARQLGVHVATIRRWVREHRVPAYRSGPRLIRIDWDEILRVLREQATAGGVATVAAEPQVLADQAPNA